VATDGTGAIVLRRPEIAADEIRHGNRPWFLDQILELVSGSMTHRVRR
jgi:hypothetical protein